MSMLDNIDYRIIRALQANGRMTIQELASVVNLSASPCLRRVRILEEQSVLKGYAAVVDEERYGLPVTVFVRIRLERHSEEKVGRFEHSIRAIGEILECYLLAGDFDYMLRVLVSDLKVLRGFHPRTHPHHPRHSSYRNELRLWNDKANVGVPRSATQIRFLKLSQVSQPLTATTPLIRCAATRSQKWGWRIYPR